MTAGRQEITTDAMRQAIAGANKLHAKLARGWNTWDTRSVLRHVLLPEGLAISFGFAANDKMVWLHGDVFPGRKVLGRTPGTLLTSMDKKLPLGDALEVRPGLHAYDGSFTQLTVDLRGAKYEIETAAEGETFVAIVKPIDPDQWSRTLTIEANLLWNRRGVIDHGAKNELIATLPSKTLHIHVRGSEVVDPNLPAKSPYVAVALDQAVVVSVGKQFTIAEATRFIANQQARQVAQHDQYQSDRDGHEAMQACLAWNVIYDPKFNRVLATVARDWNVIRGGYAVFCWDSFFMSWMLSLDDPTLGYATFLESFREMIDGKFVPNIVQGSGRASRDRSQPPVAGLAMLAMYRQRPDEASLRAVWPALMAWNRWWHTDRRNRAGSLSSGSNPFDPRVGDPSEFVQPNTRAGAALESGLDNANIYDDAGFDTKTHLLEAEDVGVNATYVADCRALAALARMLRLESDVRELEAREIEYRNALQKLWDDDRGLYLNRALDKNDWIERYCLTSFWPMASGTSTPAQAQRMSDEYLANPERFDGEWVLPMSPRNDPTFAEQLYLRGRVWPPTNFLVYLGLRLYLPAVARRKLVDRSREIVLQSWKKYNVVAENYSAIDGTGGRETHTHPLHGWGGLFSFIGLIEAGYAKAPFDAPAGVEAK